MDLRRIRQFVVLAETLNFRRAAERLHIAQPALTISIQKLEAEIGAPLFTRDQRSVALTAVGRAALQEARRTLFHGTQMLEIAEGTINGTAGLLRLGFAASTTYGLLPRLVTAFRAELPGVELVLQEADSNRIMQMLDEEAIDVGLVRTPLVRPSEAVVMPLERDEFLAAIPRASPLAIKEPFYLRDLADQQFIMHPVGSALGSATMALCQAGGFLPHVAQEARQLHTILALVGSGLGVALVPSIMKPFAGDKVSIRAFADAVQGGETGLALAYRADLEIPAAQRFRSLAARIYGAG